MILVQKIVIMIMMMITNMMMMAVVVVAVMMMIMEQLKVELNKIRACCHLRYSTCTSLYQVQPCLKKAVNRVKLHDLRFIEQSDRYIW